jgi:hypothetical protein
MPCAAFAAISFRRRHYAIDAAISPLFFIIFFHASFSFSPFRLPTPLFSFAFIRRRFHADCRLSPRGGRAMALAPLLRADYYADAISPIFDVSISRHIFTPPLILLIRRARLRRRRSHLISSFAPFCFSRALLFATYAVFDYFFAAYFACLRRLFFAMHVLLLLRRRFRLCAASIAGFSMPMFLRRCHFRAFH